MLKIICVCGMGLGSSVIAKMNLESILVDLNIAADIEVCDLGSVNMLNADYFITTRELADNIPKNLENQTIVLSNFVNKKEIEKVVIEKIKLKDEQ